MTVRGAGRAPCWRRATTSWWWRATTLPARCVATTPAAERRVQHMPWKGAAPYYPQPKEAAAEITGHVALWRGVTIEAAD
jgi:hypothetical protein